MADLDPATLREFYAEMPDGELLALASQAELLEAAARPLLDSELRRRSLAPGDVAAFEAENRAETRKAERARRKHAYRILVGAAGPWESTFDLEVGDPWRIQNWLRASTLRPPKAPNDRRRRTGGLCDHAHSHHVRDSSPDTKA